MNHSLLAERNERSKKTGNFLSFFASFGNRWFMESLQVILACIGSMPPGFRYGVPALAGEALDPSDARELRQPCRLKAGLQTRPFMEKGRHNFMPTWSGSHFIR